MTVDEALSSAGHIYVSGQILDLEHANWLCRFFTCVDAFVYITLFKGKHWEKVLHLTLLCRP